MINAELLAKIKAEIDKRYAEYREKKKTDDFTYYEGMADALDLFEQFIDSLESEQDQPDFPTTNEQVKEFLATHSKVELPEKYKTPDWIFEKSEKPMQDGLDEEIREYMSNEDNNPFDWDWRDKRDCARHFAKWGAEHTPLPEDTVLFQKGVEEGKRLMMEEAVEGKIIFLLNGDVAISVGDTDKYKLGEKVSVIVLKKED